MDRLHRQRAALATVLVIGGSFIADDAGAQPSDVSPATDFRFDSAFAVDPPDPAYWEPPPGGFLKDGRYVGQTPDGKRDVVLTFSTEYSGAFLESQQWQDETFIRSYHEQLLEAQLADLRERSINRVVSASSASLDRRFPLPAIERRVLLDDFSSSTGRTTRTIAEYSWRFPHPNSPIVEFVVSVSNVIDPGEQAPEITAEQLGFLDSIQALPLDLAPDIAISVPGKHLDAIAKGHDALWVTDYETNTLIRIDLSSRLPAATIPVGTGPHSIATTDLAVWVANHNDDSIMRIDPVANRVDVTAQVPVGPHQLLAYGTDLWLVADASCLINVIDQDSGQLKGDSLSLGSVRRSLSGRRERLWSVLGQRVGRCTDLSVSMATDGNKGLWAFERFRGTLTRIENGHAVEPIETGAEIGGFVIVNDDLWGIDDLDTTGKVYRVDIGSGKILATIDAGQVSGTPIFAGGLIWATRERDNNVIRIDPATNTLRGSPIPLNRPSAIVADESGIWVSGGTSVVHIPLQ